MPLIGELAVRLVADAADFRRAMAGAQESFSALVSVATASTAAFAGITAALTKVTLAADDQRASMLRVRNAFRAAGQDLDADRLESFAGELQRITGIGDEVSLAAAGMVAEFGASQGAIEQLLPRIQDLSVRVGGMDSAARLVGAAFSGQADILQRYVGRIDDATKAVLQHGSEQQRVAAITGLLDGKFSGLAATMAGTVRGQTAALTGVIGDLFEVLGEPLVEPAIAVLRGLVDAVASATQWIKQLGDDVRTGFSALAAGGAVVTGLAAVATTLGAVGLMAPRVAAGIAVVGKAALVLVPLLLKIAVIVAGVIAIVGAMRLAWDKWGGAAMDALGRVASMLTSKLGPALRKVSQLIVAGAAALGLMDDEAAQALFDELERSEAGFFSDAGQRMVEAGEALGDAMTDAIKGIGPLLKREAKGFGAVMRAGVDTIGDGLSAIFGGLGAQLRGMLGFEHRRDRERQRQDAQGAQRDGLAKAFDAMVDPIEAEFAAVEFRFQETEAALQRAVAAEEAAAQSQIDASDALTGSLAATGRSMLGALGPMGNLASTVIEATAAGGPIAGVAAGAAMLLQETEGFQDIIGDLTRLFAALVGAVAPLTRMLQPIVRILVDALMPVLRSLGVVLAALAPLFDLLRVILSPLAPIMEALGEVLMIVARVVHTIVAGIAEVWNGIIDAVQTVFRALADVGRFELFGEQVDLFGFMHEWADALDDAKITVRDFDGIVDDATNDFDGAMGAATEGMGAMSEQMARATEELTNVPSGFRVALARFEATDVGDGSMGVPFAEAAAPIIVEQVIVQANDAAALADELHRMSRWERIVATGISGPRAPPFATEPRSGALRGGVFG